MAVRITQGNIDDRRTFKSMTKGLNGKIYTDKGYISKTLLQILYARRLHLITGIKNNMKNYLLPMLDKILLHKRFLIENIFG